jgi:hypothetical protein
MGFSLPRKNPPRRHGDTEKIGKRRIYRRVRSFSNQAEIEQENRD